MNLIQQIAASIAAMGLCTMLHFGIKNWREIVRELTLKTEKR